MIEFSYPAHKACWLTSEDEKQLEEFRKLKQRFIARDKYDRLVYLADSSFSLQMAIEKYDKLQLPTQVRRLSALKLSSFENGPELIYLKWFFQHSAHQRMALHLLNVCVIIRQPHDGRGDDHQDRVFAEGIRGF